MGSRTNRHTNAKTNAHAADPSMVAIVDDDAALAGTGGQQLTFGATEIAEPHRPAGANRRAAAKRTADRAIESADRADTPERAEARAQVVAHLRTWLAELAIGDDFQAADFNAWMVTHGGYPDASVYDPRATGALFRRLRSRGVIAFEGYRSNRGNPETGYHATTRAVYRLARHPEEGDLS